MRGAGCVPSDAPGELRMARWPNGRHPRCLSSKESESIRVSHPILHAWE